MKGISATPPIGIIITLPARFFEENPIDRYNRQINRTNNGEYTWERVMKNLPTADFLYVYTVYNGHVQHRMNLVEMWRGKTKQFIRPDGSYRVFENCNGIATAGPVVRPKDPIPMKGFQGFRYVYKELF